MNRNLKVVKRVAILAGVATAVVAGVIARMVYERRW
jgi:hypothetical protein